MLDKFEAAFEVFGEGGGLTITRITKDGKENFLFNNQEFDPTDEGMDISVKETYLNFQEPFELINQYPWHLLHVENDHKDYADYVSEKLVEKLNSEEVSPGQRLKQHISDRLSGRWDRFSWFGFFSVDDTGH